ncbi:hypothetical protein HQN90_37445 [Paenibacillus alba]|nr:hypothetical protein [Paenibacillus alba]
MMTIVALLTVFHVHSVEAFDGAEVFDIQKGEVVATIKNSPSLQSEVAKWLSSISGPVESLHIEPDRGLGFLEENHLYKPELNLKIPSVAER